MFSFGPASARVVVQRGSGGRVMRGTARLQGLRWRCSVAGFLAALIGYDVSGVASVAVPTHKQQPNKALHPTAYSPLVPRSLPAAGELGRCLAARGVAVNHATIVR